MAPHVQCIGGGGGGWVWQERRERGVKYGLLALWLDDRFLFYFILFYFLNIDWLLMQVFKAVGEERQARSLVLL